MNCRFATPSDATTLAQMNQQLIRDEGHRNRMTLAELEERMPRFLQIEYNAILFDAVGTLGYAVYKYETDWIYLRQFFVLPERRREGIGREALRWLQKHAWRDQRRIRIDVLSGNPAGTAFWRSMGFTDYCVTMELERELDPGSSAR